ncbi:MAG: hypothetical protein P8012_15585 [Desulfobacterales bacterium]
MNNAGKEFCMFLEKKLAQFKQYQSVTEKMKQVVCDKEKNKEISGLISKRQSCIGDIEKVNASIEKIIKNSAGGLSRIPQKYKGLIDSYMASIKDVMIQVDLMDRELVVIVAEQRDDIKTELLKMRNMRQAASGYESGVKYPARFLDTRR